MNNTQAPAVAGPTHSVPAVSERSRASYHGIGKAGEHPALMRSEEHTSELQSPPPRLSPDLNTQAPAFAGPPHSVPAVSERSRASYHGIGKAGEHPALMCLNNAALALEKAKTLPELKEIGR